MQISSDSRMQKKCPWSVLGYIALCFFMWPSVVCPAFAQMNTAEIVGDVTDQTGARVRGVRVTALHLATQGEYATTSDTEGDFLLPQLPLGEFTLLAESPGFKQAVREHIILRVNDHALVHISLQVGNSKEVVTVQSRPEHQETQSAAIKDVMENREITSLPLKNRQMLQLALLSEGVVNPPGGTRGESLQQTGQLINVLGQRAGHNLFLLNGTNITDKYYNNVVVNVSPDAIQEFIIDKTSYEAQFGGKSGAIINVVTKSGTNSFHGTAFEFFRNDALDAVNYFARKNAPAPAYKENQFGGTLGGPIVRNKSFFLRKLRRFKITSGPASSVHGSHCRTENGPTGGGECAGPLRFGSRSPPESGAHATAESAGIQ